MKLQELFIFYCFFPFFLHPVPCSELATVLQSGSRYGVLKLWRAGEKICLFNDVMNQELEIKSAGAQDSH
jgi:hypothetical protein